MGWWGGWGGVLVGVGGGFGLVWFFLLRGGERPPQAFDPPRCVCVGWCSAGQEGGRLRPSCDLPPRVAWYLSVSAPVGVGVVAGVLLEVCGVVGWCVASVSG